MYTESYTVVGPQKDGRLTIENQIEPAMQSKQLTLRKATSIFDQTDIRNELFYYSDYRTNPTFPTAFFIDTDYGETSRKAGCSILTRIWFLDLNLLKVTSFENQLKFYWFSIQFRASTSGEVPSSMQTTLIKSEKLVRTAAHLDFFPMQSIHLARSILHLIISLIEDTPSSTSEKKSTQMKDLQRYASL